MAARAAPVIGLGVFLVSVGAYLLGRQVGREQAAAAARNAAVERLVRWYGTRLAEVYREAFLAGWRALRSQVDVPGGVHVCDPECVAHRSDETAPS